KLALSGKDSGELVVTDLARGSVRLLEKNRWPILSAAISGDGKLAASVAGLRSGDWTLWDLASGRRVRQPQSNNGYWPRVAFARGGGRLVTGDLVRGLSTWAVPSGHEQVHLDQGSGLADTVYALAESGDSVLAGDPALNYPAPHGEWSPHASLRR